VTALAINVTIPERLRWTGTQRSEEFTPTTLNVRLLSDGRLAVKAYGRPADGGLSTYVSGAAASNLDANDVHSVARHGWPWLDAY
jgi:hypothetical protein